MQAIKTLPFEEVYMLRTVISRGIMGNVYKVINRLNESVYAAKKILKSKIKDFDKKKFYQRAQILLKLQHPNIVNNLEIYDNPEAVYIVMEYIKGIDLFDWLIKLNSRDEAKICNTFKTILDAIEITHSRGIVHGYIQPTSIMVSDDQGSPTIKLVSFHRSLFPQFSYNSIYSAPQGDLQLSADFWSLGILLYVMLTGISPLQKKNYSKVQDDQAMFPWQQWRYISCCSKNLLQNLLKLDPKQRFQIQDIKNHPWLDNIGNLSSEYPQLKNNLYRQNFNLRTEKAMNVTKSYLEQ